MQGHNIQCRVVDMTMDALKINKRICSFCGAKLSHAKKFTLLPSRPISHAFLSKSYNFLFRVNHARAHHHRHCSVRRAISFFVPFTSASVRPCVISPRPPLDLPSFRPSHSPLFQNDKRMLKASKPRSDTIRQTGKAGNERGHRNLGLIRRQWRCF